ncbi:MAG TPA: hypothetical protein VH255_04210, partial [Verrucomicrobiae bacterium]|nr:hypothetical protein [Verrucomicrobiae bacterium]
MTIHPESPLNPKYRIPCEHPFYLALCWKAVFAGAVAAIGIHILLFALGVAGGLTLFTPVTDANPVAHFSIGAAIIWDVCAVVALLFGGMMAGRFSNSPQSGFAHGILVWSLTLMAAVLLAITGSSFATHAFAKIMGTGNNPIHSNLADVLKENTIRRTDEINSFVNEAISPDAHDSDAIGVRRDLTAAVTKLFAPGNDVSSPEDRASVVAILSGLIRNPDRMLNHWIAYHQNLQAESAAAEQKARVAADRAAANL